MKTNFLTAILVVFFIVSCKQTENSQQVSDATSVNIVKYEIKISGMTCTGCEQTIQSAVTELNGIKNIKASHTEGNAIIEFDTALTDTNAIKLAINNTGYTVLEFVPEN
jgi:copper chaperone CopZ